MNCGCIKGRGEGSTSPQAKVLPSLWVTHRVSFYCSHYYQHSVWCECGVCVVCGVMCGVCDVLWCDACGVCGVCLVCGVCGVCGVWWMCVVCVVCVWYV
jgi:hypothetical protein